MMSRQDETTLLQNQIWLVLFQIFLIKTSTNLDFLGNLHSGLEFVFLGNEALSPVVNS